MTEYVDPLESVLDSAARLQQLVPDAVLVGGSAVAFYARHRYSLDGNHIVVDLRNRFDVVLDALEREGDWVTNRVTPGKIILGEIGGIEAGVRQLIRTTPLETQIVKLRSGLTLRVPTVQETLRVKAFLIIKRNQVRDYLDVVALADFYGIQPSAHVLARIDDFYADQKRGDVSVASQLTRQLEDPRPKDSHSTSTLSTYKGISQQWQKWDYVVNACRDLAEEIDETGGSQQ
ncbi:hypothetical protein [Subtercola frigoramans]|uniref:Nucleotidyl transferase AbiEii/AbiGii toxin family protein n=1 Tax=Subtercola frigoramans TaxID=120298 RepID=A0ABS2L8G7_9MICO|nr:hypothetical protein [Subtercola frigoramans]MBM7473393.1 hypothetical protein [Subtercola frigoramans]